MTNRQRIAIYREIKEYYQQHPVRSFASVKLRYTGLPGLPGPPCPIYLHNSDTIDCALHVKYTLGFTPLVLNMANASTPGGGVEHGAIAQEESLFRRSNYHLTLTPNFYPIAPDELIYSPNVHIKTEKPGGCYLDFVASAALERPVIPYSPTDRFTMQAKINHLFEVGITYGYDTLILGAFGCGAFRNPPGEVVQLFNQAIRTYGGAFKRIDFAILKHVYGKTAAVDNYDIFRDELGSKRKY